MRIYESSENYLETILILKNKNSVVRSIDIVNELSVTKPSVSVAMKSFREEGYIEVDNNGYITLTKKGLEIAERIYERHKNIAKFFIKIGVSEENAYTDSCKIEHYISNESYERIKDFIKKNV